MDGRLMVISGLEIPTITQYKTKEVLNISIRQLSSLQFLYGNKNRNMKYTLACKHKYSSVFKFIL